MSANRKPRPFVYLAAIFLSEVAVAVLTLKSAPAPFFWIWLTCAGALLGAMVLTHGSWPRAILLNLGIASLLLALLEAWLIIHEYVPPTYPDGGFIVADDVLGWAPAKGIRAHAIKTGPAGLLQGPKGLLFDTTYSIDSSGLRVAPPFHRDNLKGTLLFFGCSFTFGEGLRDDQTLPYQVGSESKGRYRTINFAFEGYGPHQMLAAIEHGMVRRAMDTIPTDAFYVAIPSHVWRVAGRTAWGGHAPRYLLDDHGTLIQSGYFGDRTPLAERLGLNRGLRQLKKSAMWRILPMRDSPLTEDDFRLYFAVIRRSQELLQAQFPGIHFHVILWQVVPQQHDAYLKLRRGFRQIGIPLDEVGDILPDYNSNQLKYVLSSVDHHPNALADRLVAQYILTNVLQGE